MVDSLFEACTAIYVDSLLMQMFVHGESATASCNIPGAQRSIRHTTKEGTLQ